MSTFSTYLTTATRRSASVAEADVLHGLVLTQADPAMLNLLIALLNKELHDLPPDTPTSICSTLMRLITHLDERREEAELATNPERRAGIARVAKHFARKAQSGWSGRPLLEDASPDESDDAR